MQTNLPISIKEATAVDAPAISNLIQQLGYRIAPEEIVKKLALIQSTSDKAWIALCDNQVCAVLVLNIIIPFHQIPLIGRIDILCVDESYRGQGIGTQLIKIAQTYAQQKGCSNIILTSSNHRTQAHAFYKSLGYRTPETTFFVKSL